MAKYKYEYRCPDCGTQLELRMRVIQTKRRCPHCGKPITPEEIDRQEMIKAVSGCIAAFIMLIFVMLLLVFIVAR